MAEFAIAVRTVLDLHDLFGAHRYTVAAVYFSLATQAAETLDFGYQAGY